MDNLFKAMDPAQIEDNVFKLIGDDWMLITAGNPEKFNTMTASWGGMGILWGKKVCFCVIRPQRYTYEFMEREENFTLTFFTDEYRKALNLCGSKSGRELDKAAAAGLTPLATEKGSVYFQEARLVVECKKLYYQDINPAHFLDASIEKNYPGKDYHRMYIGEIIDCKSRA